MRDDTMTVAERAVAEHFQLADAAERYRTASVSQRETMAEVIIGPAPAFRTQDDGLGDEMSKATAFTTDEISRTRPEFAEEKDINYMLDRFGVNQQQRPVTYGEMDMNPDLQSAMLAIAEAKKVVATVPPELRTKYPDWRSVLNAAESGQYALDLEKLEQEKAEQAKAAAAKETPNPAPTG